VNHGVVDVFAYQEALLMEAIFGIALLAMIWVGFRRWLQHKEKMGRLTAEEHSAHLERVDARLKVVEQIVTDGAVPPAAQIDALRTSPLPDPIPKRDEV
jgi:hypothetical protein